MLALLLLGDCANFDEESQVDSETTTTITTTAERGVKTVDKRADGGT